MNTETENRSPEMDYASDGGGSGSKVGGVAKPKSAKKKKASKKPQPIESLRGFLRAIYSGEFKRLTLSKDEFTSISKSPLPDELTSKELLRLACLDLTLHKTRQLLLIYIRLSPRVHDGKIENFVRDVLLRHPAFDSELFAAVLANLPHAVGDESAVSALMARDFASFSWPNSSVAYTKKDSDQCKRNSLHCLLLLFYLEGRNSEQEILNLLRQGLWEAPARKYKTEALKLFALINNRDHAAASIVFGMFEGQLKKHKNRALVAIRGETEAKNRSEKIAQNLRIADENLTNVKEENLRLSTELQKLKNNHENEKAHLRDDYEQLRGQVLNRLKTELALLDEGLHALRRNPPKVHVMVDHAERAIDGLKQELERIRGSNK